MIFSFLVFLGITIYLFAIVNSIYLLVPPVIFSIATIAIATEAIIAPWFEKVVVTDNTIEFHFWWAKKPKAILQSDIHLVVRSHMCYIIMNAEKETILQTTAKYKNAAALATVLMGIAAENCYELERQTSGYLKPTRIRNNFANLAFPTVNLMEQQVN